MACAMEGMLQQTQSTSPETIDFTMGIGIMARLPGRVCPLVAKKGPQLLQVHKTPLFQAPRKCAENKRSWQGQ